MRFVILAHLEDNTALRVYATLRTRHGAGQVKLVSSEELVFAPHWTHRLEYDRATTRLRLADGTSLDSDQLGVMFNRLQYIQMPHFERAAEADREYAVQETYAFWLSWLASLPCPVVNLSTPRGLAGQQRSWPEWIKLAVESGLPVRGYRFTTDPRHYQPGSYLPFQRQTPPSGYDAPGLVQIPTYLIGRQPVAYLEPVRDPQEHILIAGKRLLGSLASSFAKPLLRFSALAGFDLMQVSFSRAVGNGERGWDQGPWKVCGVSAFPHTSGAQEVGAIVDLLEAREAQGKMTS